MLYRKQFTKDNEYKEIACMCQLYLEFVVKYLILSVITHLLRDEVKIPTVRVWI